MELIDIKPGDRLWDEVWTLYEGSFPIQERRSERVHALTLRNTDFRTRIAVGSGGELLGILFYWEHPDYLYIEHLAVNPALRGQNIGSRLLGSFIERNRGRRVILEIDPPEDEISVRRLHFYQRLGFVANDYHYIHPGFGPPGERMPHRLILLSHPDGITPEQFDGFERYVNEHVVLIPE